ncbi:MAG: TonB-dependent receptor [Cyclobacteriaceae bacterium]
MIKAQRLLFLALSLLLILYGFQSHAQNNSMVALTGEVTSKWTGETIVGVNVFFPSLERGVATNTEGKYKISVPRGTFSVEFRRVGLQTVTMSLDILNDQVLNVEMMESTKNLNELIIYSEKADANVKSLDVGKNILDIEKINSLPSFMGEPDLVKSLILLPGVSTVGEGASGFNVRGGGIDQNLILQDDALILNSSHVFGFFSVFNPLLVKNATLYKSNMPVSYGGRLSSVLDVELKEGDYQKHNVSGGIGLISSKLAVDGPIIKDKLSFVVGGRVSYSDWLLRRAEDVNLKKSSAAFNDFNLKLSLIVDEKNKIWYSGYRSEDGFSFASDTTFSWYTTNHALAWSHLFSDSFSVKTSLVTGAYSYNIKDEKGVNSFKIDSKIKYQNLKFTGQLGLYKNNRLLFGLESYIYNFYPGNQFPLSETSGVESLDIEKEKSIEGAIFLEDEITLNDRLSIKAGLRFSGFSNLGPGTDYIYENGQSRTQSTITDTVYYANGEKIASYLGPEPRLAINYSLNQNSSIKASFNRNRQYLHLISNTTASTPTDFWKTSNKYLEPEVNDQISLGYFRNFVNNTIETSVELYHKSASNILDYKDGSVLLMNTNIETDLIPGTAEAYGFELFMNKKAGALTGWMSYTFSRTFREVNGIHDDEVINQGNRYPANYDKPHDFTLALNYKTSPIVDFGINFTYNTGRPVTVPLSAYNISNLSGIANFSLRNQRRIPDYHRLDLSMTMKSKPKIDRKWNYSWTFALYNVYGRKNAYSVFFKNEFGSPPQAYKMSVLGSIFPSIMLNFNI